MSLFNENQEHDNLKFKRFLTPNKMDSLLFEYLVISRHYTLVRVEFLPFLIVNRFFISTPLRFISYF